MVNTRRSLSEQSRVDTVTFVSGMRYIISDAGDFTNEDTGTNNFHRREIVLRVFARRTRTPAGNSARRLLIFQLQHFQHQLVKQLNDAVIAVNAPRNI